MCSDAAASKEEGEESECDHLIGREPGTQVRLRPPADAGTLLANAMLTYDPAGARQLGAGHTCALPGPSVWLRPHLLLYTAQGQ